jgi:hypothetical protein
VDFNGNPGNIDYRLPRMSFIKNKDFLHLERVDRDINTSTEYGVLPVSFFHAICFLFLLVLEFSYYFYSFLYFRQIIIVLTYLSNCFSKYVS